MSLLRYVYLVALTIWLGGLVVLGALVAPTLFDVLPAQEPELGRHLAGTGFAAILGRFHLVMYAAGAALLFSLIAMKLLGPRPVGFGFRVGIVSAMLAIALFSGLGVTPRIERLQREIGAPVATLREDDPRRARFDRLHRLSTALMMLNVVGGFALLYWEARET